ACSISTVTTWPPTADSSRAASTSGSAVGFSFGASSAITPPPARVRPSRPRGGRGASGLAGWYARPTAVATRALSARAAPPTRTLRQGVQESLEILGIRVDSGPNPWLHVSVRMGRTTRSQNDDD